MPCPALLSSVRGVRSRRLDSELVRGPARAPPSRFGELAGWDEQTRPNRLTFSTFGGAILPLALYVDALQLTLPDDQFLFFSLLRSKKITSLVSRLAYNAPFVLKAVLTYALHAIWRTDLCVVSATSSQTRPRIAD